MDDNGTNDRNNDLMQKQMEDMLTTTSMITANNDAI
jgi:hypothetical protein